jgi:bifunctional non-homologous end joining protein LigD
MIPEGEYGGGHVALFDNGVWSTQGDPEAQLAKGHLRFELFGQRLKGGWHLVRTQRSRSARQPEWLLFKEADAFAATDLEADDLLAGVTPPPLDSKGAKQMPAKQLAVAAKALKAKATPAPVRARRKAVDWAARAATLPGARKARLADRAFAPQLARLRSNAPAGDQWLHEIKWDGYRILVTVVKGKARAWSRNAIEWTAKLPEVMRAIEGLGLQEAAFDGELIAGHGDQTSFGLLQSTLSGERNAPLSYVVFDLLHLDGVSIARAPLLARKQLLAALLGTPPRPLAYSSHVVGGGEAAFAMASEKAYEGIISKRIDQPYAEGRGDDWVKVKRLDSDEFAVVGVTPPKGSRTGLGSLLLARPDAQHGWAYAGRVGSGFTDEQLRDLAKRLGKDGSARPTVHVAATDTDLRAARWFEPRFVVEVFTRGTGNQGLLRQPSLKAIRFDKDPNDLNDSDRRPAKKTVARTSVVKEAAPRKTAKSAPAAKKQAKPAAPRKTSAQAPPAKKTGAKKAAGGDGTAGGYRISSPERVVFADAGITKQQVADYYLGVADHLLGEIRGRPLSIIRCPDGAAGTCFFQKHHTPGLAAVGSARLKEESGVNANYLVVEDLDGLMALVQFNALEFHPWGAMAKTPDKCDRIVFDLDPGPGVSWTQIKQAAVQVRDLLAQLQITSFLRTSGGKGLHVVAPLNPGCPWPLVKKFTRGFADAMAANEPDKYVATATKSLRDGRIFIDYLRNGRGATSVASYSLRARPGAPAATPLAWSELARLPRANHYDLHTLPRRLARLKADPWAGIDAVRQDLSRWADAKPRAPRKR